MPTSAQIAANQANAQKSTAPLSDAAKAISSQNRRVHGLAIGSQFIVLPCENQADFERLLSDLDHAFDPANAVEALLVKCMAEHQWLRDRATRLQESCFDQQTGDIVDNETFSNYLRYYTTHDRAFHKCLNDLLKIREEQKLKIGFEREKREEELHPLRGMQKEMEITMLQIKASDAEFKKIAPELGLEAA